LGFGEQEMIVELERFSSLHAVSDGVGGGFFFHPSDEDLSPGTPEWKKPLSCNGRPLQQLENRYSGRKSISSVINSRLRGHECGFPQKRRLSTGCRVAIRLAGCYSRKVARRRRPYAPGPLAKGTGLCYSQKVVDEQESLPVAVWPAR
jgi:hypothetical protein